MGILLRRVDHIETNKYRLYFKKDIKIEIDPDYITFKPFDFKIKLGKIGLDKYIKRKFNHIVWFYYRSIAYKLLRKKNPYKAIIKSIYRKQVNSTWKKIY